MVLSVPLDIAIHPRVLVVSAVQVALDLVLAAVLGGIQVVGQDPMVLLLRLVVAVLLS